MHAPTLVFTSETDSGESVERDFSVGDITGVLWTPANLTTPRPLILIGHGGGQNKRSPGIVGRARAWTAGGRFTVAAIDAPGHGDRARSRSDDEFAATLGELMVAGKPVASHLASYHSSMIPRAVADWRAALDELLKLERIAQDGPVGYWGVSFGAAMGIPLIAADPRITAAVVGLVDLDTVASSAPSVTIPVEFLMQRDDELVSRESALALFDALGSDQKTLHANPGPHAAIPRFEVDSAHRFFERHLT